MKLLLHPSTFQPVEAWRQLFGRQRRHAGDDAATGEPATEWSNTEWADTQSSFASAEAEWQDTVTDPSAPR